MGVHLSDVNIFDVSKMVIRKMDKGYRVELWDDKFLPTSHVNIPGPPERQKGRVGNGCGGGEWMMTRLAQSS